MQGKCIREKGANVYESVCAFKQLLAFANKQMRPYVSVILAKRNDNNDEMMTMMATMTMITTKQTILSSGRSPKHIFCIYHVKM